MATNEIEKHGRYVKDGLIFLSDSEYEEIKSRPS